MLTVVDAGYYSLKMMYNPSARGRPETEVDSFPSLIGSPDVSEWALNGSPAQVVEVNGTEYLVGQDVLDYQAGLTYRTQDRNWYYLDEWIVPILTGITRKTSASKVPVEIITGLPVQYYGDREAIRGHYLDGTNGTFLVSNRAMGYDWRQRIVITDIKFTMQGVGLVLRHAIPNPQSVYATEMVAAVDLGSNTTNVVVMNKMRPAITYSRTFERGAWNIVKLIRAYLDQNHPDHKPSDHEIAGWLTQENPVLRYPDRDYPLKPVVDKAISSVIRATINDINILWRSLNIGGMRILLGGGLARSEQVVQAFKDEWGLRIVTPDYPEYSNLFGYYWLAMRAAQQKG